jgi:DNA repair ATPase RecN
MNFKILKIILWPKNDLLPLRTIDFKIDKVNIITGESHKGKSALIQIIDYCLGSEKCNIPVGKIRDNTSWFGLHVITENTELILARLEPGDQQSTDEMFILEDIKIEQIVKPSKNVNRKSVINRLNQLSGFSSLAIEDDEYKGFGKPSFRDTAAFQFQPQNVVANPTTLFYRIDSYEYREKLKNIFPLLLGIITNETLRLKRELKLLKAELKTKEAEYLIQKNSIENWYGKVKGMYNYAKEVGLIEFYPKNDNNLPTSTYISYLKEIPSKFNENPIPPVINGGTEKAVKELTHLISKEKEISFLIESRRIRLANVEKLNTSSENYKQIIDFEKGRILPANWFKEKLEQQSNCPFCNSNHNSAQAQINSLLQELENLEVFNSSLNSTELALDEEVMTIKDQIKTLELRLKKIRDEIGELNSKSHEASNNRQSLEEIYRFVGKLDQALENLNLIELDNELANDIESMKSQIERIENRIDPSKERVRKEITIAKLSLVFSKYIKRLAIERKDDVVELDLVNLTLLILSNNRKDFLSEIGSGANYVGYHLATLLGLHEFFLTLKKSYVPTFLVIDQPSQVYFPEDNSITESSDIQGVKQILKCLSYSIAQTKNELQIILLDHIPPRLWSDIENIHLVEEWRDNNALIPSSWLTDKK